MKKDTPDDSLSTTSTPSLPPQPMMTLYEKIYLTKDDILTEALLTAICEGYEIPTDLNDYLRTYQQNYLNPGYVGSKVTLTEHCQTILRNTDTQKFKQLLITRRPINSGLIESLRSTLTLEIEETLLIEGKIIDGKVYYITISPWSGEVVESDIKSQKVATFKYDPNTCFRMTPDQFLEFKQAGKRTGNHEINYREFAQLVERDIESYDSAKALVLFQELKEMRIIDSHNRLSSNWQNLLGAKVELEHCATKYLPLLNGILAILASKGSRQHRTPMQWNSEGCTFAKRSDESKTLAWDVATKAELEHFSTTSDNLSFVHLPDQKKLNRYLFSNKSTISEKPQQWMALAIPTDRIEGKESNLSTVEDLLSVAATPSEVGAVRRLYRSSVKEYSPAAGQSPVGKTPHLFWKNAPQDRKEADQKISACLNSFSSKP